MGSKRKRAPKEVPNDTTAAQQPTQKRSKKEPPSEPTTESAPNGAAATAKTRTPKVTLFVEHPTGDDRKREAELYDQLGREDESERIKAAHTIISSLLSGDGVDEPILRRHLEKRLFRGLASGRNASRLGFSLVITEILGQLFGKEDLVNKKYTGLGFEEVKKILVKSTTPFGNLAGQEERNHWFGQLFGVECFVRSGILFSDLKKWTEVLDLLLGLSMKKSWLKTQCGYVIVQAVAQMGKKMAEETLAKLAEEGFAKTPEGVGVWITALDRFPDMRVPGQPWRNPLAASSLSALPAALKDSGREQTSDEGGKKPKAGNWTAQLHFVWDLILAHFARAGQKSEAEAAEQFEQFWNRVVDEGFFSKNSSDSQKFSGFMIFQKMLEGALNCEFIVKILFSKNLMACLMNQAAKEDRYLHRAAIKALKALEAAAQHNPTWLPTILKGLFGKYGAYNFDQRTNTKTIDRILQHTTSDTIKPVLKVLQLKDPSKSGLDFEQYYQALGNYLLRLSNALSEEQYAKESNKRGVAQKAIKVLAELAYSNKAVPEKVRATLRTRATSAFAKLTSRSDTFTDLCDAILSIETEVNPEDELALTVLPRAFGRLKDLLDGDKTTKATEGPRQALALLFAVGILQFYNQDPDVMDLFDELEECYGKLVGESDEEEAGIAEFLVEILLAMVARPSALMKQVSRQVFEAFTPLMSAEAIGLLTDPLAADESAKGQQALFSTEDEDMMDAEGGSDDESEIEDDTALDSDVEMANLEDAGSDAGDADSEDDSEDDGSDEEEDEAEKENQETLDALDKALSEALGTHRLDQDADAESDDGSDMTDSEMMAVDEKLAEIFRHRTKATSKKKENKDAKETVVNFKHRVLDLLGIFIKKESTQANPLVFDAVLPLLNLIRTTTTKPLANKAHEAIQNLSKGIKKARSDGNTPDIEGSEHYEMLEKLHEEAAKDPSHAFTKAVSTCCLTAASLMCNDDDTEADDMAKVFNLYAETQLKWFRGEVKIQASFFSDWLNWCQAHANAAASSAAKKEEK
ncbi:DNA polymerase phi-domain-containing protein [Triangularia verruculosa]|uniref:DNA polymerase phi-domain-containing protein n=1 Tax=Triangularia verruculosa TaxID=2587418 RepID=A0AAN6XII0_9PEZI|nr:DNA polymerase phi-domain-containing protein [Triangularia verruculosa]